MNLVKLNNSVRILEPTTDRKRALIEVRVRRRELEEIANGSAQDAVVIARRTGEIPEHWDVFSIEMSEGKNSHRVLFDLPEWPTAWTLYDRVVEGVTQKTDADADNKPPRTVQEMFLDLIAIRDMASSLIRPLVTSHAFAYSPASRKDPSTPRGTDHGDPTLGVLTSRPHQIARVALSQFDHALIELLADFRAAQRQLTGMMAASDKGASRAKPPQLDDKGRTIITDPEEARKYPVITKRSDREEAEEAQRRRAKRGEE